METSTWFYTADAAERGPVTVQVIRSLARKGIIASDTPVREGSGGRWVPYSSVQSRLSPVVASASVAAAPSAPPTPSPPAAPATNVWAPPSPPAGGAAVAANVNVAAPSGAMGFGEAISTCLRKYATFRGRASRAEFWYFQLFGVLLYAALFAVDVALLLDAIGTPVLTPLGQLALLLPYYAVLVRRLHDTDKSGWWVFVGLVPLVGMIALLVFVCQRGTVGPNRFG